MEKTIAIRTILTEDGQLPLPDELRRASGLNPGEEVEIRLEEGRLIVAPITTVAEAMWGTIQLNEEQIQEVLPLDVWEER